MDKESTPRAGLAPHGLLWAGIVTLLVLLFHGLGNTVANVHSRSVFVWMVMRWSDRVSFGADYSIGWFIPVISLGLVLHERRALRAAARRVNPWGLAIVIGALFLHWAAARAQQPRMSLVALVAIIWALPLYFYGGAVARRLLFPCGYLLFCIPWNFLDGLSFPLRIISTALSAALLNGLGLAVVRSGTLIHAVTPGGFDLNVVDPCSGLSSMLAMLALTALVGYLTQPTFWRKTALFAAAIPLAMAGNIFRIVTIAVVAHTVGHDMAMKLYHDYSALLVFPVAILLMAGFASFMRRFTWSKLPAWIGLSSKPS